MTKTPVNKTRTHSVKSNSDSSIGTRREILKKAVAAGILTGAALKPASAQSRPRATELKAIPITKTRAIRVSPLVTDEALVSRIDKILTKDLKLDETKVSQTIDLIQEILPDLGADTRTGILTVDIAMAGANSVDCTGNACSTHTCDSHGCTGEGCGTQGCTVQTCNGHGCTGHGCSKTSFGDASDVTEFAQDMLASAWYDLGQLQNEMMDMKNFVLEIRNPLAMQIQTRFIR